MMDTATMRGYAALLLDACLGIGPGARLRVAAEPCHRRLMHAVAEAAYARGARQVRLDYFDPRLSRIRTDSVREEWVEDVSALVRREAETYVEEGWVSLNLVGEEDPKAMEGADPSRVQRALRARSGHVKPFRDAMMSNRLAWCVAPAPTEAWGRSVFLEAGRDPGPDPEAALWAELVPILRLDSPDPAKAAREHGEALQARARALDALALGSLRFQAPGTDLFVRLSPRSRWIGGGSRMPDGRFFLPNHPTEEVFTSPDAGGTEGRAACTRPVDVLGAKVEGAWFEFEGGRVVHFGAARNEAMLGRYLDSDEGARRLGEAALVDATGPIFKSGLVFGNTLIDENAACHIALGASYDEAFEGAAGMDEATKKREGFNDSIVHTDFMIGSERMEVTGTARDGREVPILRGGRFAI
ncbi:MAG TPA: aminopeptidase [Spirochaetales bacterium]|nr:aminopeptidase [Spirochaetales bacterium]